jgi:hypothetical protein
VNLFIISNGGRIMTGPGRNVIPTKFLYVQILIIVCFVFCYTSAFSQIDQNINIKKVTFTDGTSVQGQVVQMSIDTITIWTFDDSIIIRKFYDVEKLENIPTWGSGPQLEGTPSNPK